MRFDGPRRGQASDRVDAADDVEELDALHELFGVVDRRHQARKPRRFFCYQITRPNCNGSRVLLEERRSQSERLFGSFEIAVVGQEPDHLLSPGRS